MTAPLAALAILSIALCLGLAAVVVAFKVARNIREPRIRRRRDALRTAIEDGGEGLCERLLSDALRGRAERIDDALWALSTADVGDGRRRNLAVMAGRGRLGDALARVRSDRDPVIRSRGALITARLAPADAIARIAEALRDPGTATAAVRALGMLGTPAAAQALIAALPAATSRDRVLDQLAHPWAADTVADALRHEGDADLRPFLIEAAGLSGACAAVPDLERALASDVTEARVRAARALGRLGTGVGALLAAMVDEEWAVRAQAAAAIALIADERPSDPVVDALSRGLADPAWWVRAHCANALSASAVGREALEAARHSPDRYARDRAEEAVVARHLLAA